MPYPPNFDHNDTDQQLRLMTYQTEKSKAVRLHMEEKYLESYYAHEKILKEEKELFGADHEEVLFSRSNMSTMLAQVKRFPEAETQMLDVIADLTRIHGDNNERPRTMRKNLANLYIDWGKLDDGLDILKNIRTFEKYTNLPRQEKMLTFELLGTAYGKKSMWKESLENLKLLWENQVQEWGELSKAARNTKKEIDKLKKKLGLPLEDKKPQVEEEEIEYDM